jgi:hypothetical protein
VLVPARRRDQKMTDDVQPAGDPLFFRTVHDVVEMMKHEPFTVCSTTTRTRFFLYSGG